MTTQDDRFKLYKTREEEQATRGTPFLDRLHEIAYEEAASGAFAYEPGAPLPSYAPAEACPVAVGVLLHTFVATTRAEFQLQRDSWWYANVLFLREDTPTKAKTLRRAVAICDACYVYHRDTEDYAQDNTVWAGLQVPGDPEKTWERVTNCHHKFPYYLQTVRNWLQPVPVFQPVLPFIGHVQAAHAQQHYTNLMRVVRETR